MNPYLIKMEIEYFPRIKKNPEPNIILLIFVSTTAAVCQVFMCSSLFQHVHNGLDPVDWSWIEGQFYDIVLPTYYLSLKQNCMCRFCLHACRIRKFERI